MLSLSKEKRIDTTNCNYAIDKIASVNSRIMISVYHLNHLNRMNKGTKENKNKKNYENKEQTKCWLYICNWTKQNNSYMQRKIPFSFFFFLLYLLLNSNFELNTSEFHQFSFISHFESFVWQPFNIMTK